jgi:hypothetical protein
MDKKLLISLLVVVAFFCSCKNVLAPEELLSLNRQHSAYWLGSFGNAKLELRYLPNEVVVANQVKQNYKDQNNQNRSKQWIDEGVRNQKSYVQLICKGSDCTELNIQKMMLYAGDKGYHSFGKLSVQQLKEQHRYEYMLMFGVSANEIARQDQGAFVIEIEELRCQLKISKEVLKLIETIHDEIN